MKMLQKFILPLLIVAIVAIIYTIYFAPSEDLGSFSDFDPNNSAVKDIRVLVVQERGINKNPDGGASFFAADNSGRVIQVSADKVPPGIESAKTVILRGHLNPNSFHAHEVLLD